MRDSILTTRRKAVGAFGAALAGPTLRGQQDPRRDQPRVPALDELTSVMEFEEIAFRKLSREAYTYTVQGSEGEFTLRRNRDAFGWVDLVPRGVADVSAIETSSQVLGTTLAYPLMAAPTAGHGQLHRDGELATHQGCTAASNTVMIVSNNATFPLDKIAAAAAGPLWFQLYPRKELDATREILDNAQAAGAKAIVMTVDQQASIYERALRERHLAPPSPTRGRSRGEATQEPGNPYRVSDRRLWYEWKYAEQVRAMIKVPLIAKGILTAEDARLCVEHGFDGICVSNHGGRSLDYAPSTLEVLTEIVDAVKGRIPVVLDSGIRSGSDLLKALALGARAVCVGRAVRWGLAAYGPAGVQRVLEILQGELVLAMAQAGRPSLAVIDRTLVRTHFR